MAFAVAQVEFPQEPQEVKTVYAIILYKQDATLYEPCTLLVFIPYADQDEELHHIIVSPEVYSMAREGDKIKVTGSPTTDYTYHQD